MGLIGASLAATFATNAPAKAVEPFDIAATLSVSFTSEVAISGDYAYVASNSAITIIDTRTNTVDTSVAISGANSPDGAAAIAGTVVFAARLSNKLIILDTTTRAVSYLDTTGCSSPSQLRVVTATRLIANCHGSGNVQIYDMTGPSIVGTVTTGTGPRGMSVANGRVFVPNSQNSNIPGTMTVVDAAASTPSALATVNVENQPEFTAYLDGKVFVANYGSSTVSIVDATSYSVLSTVAVGTNPQGLADCSTHVYSANRTSGNTSVMSPSSNTVTDTVLLAGPGATTHVVGAQGDYAYFLNFSDRSVSVVDCTDQTVAATIPIGVSPSKIAFASEYAYVTSTGSPGTITVIAIPPTPDPDPTPGAATVGGRYAEFVFELADGRECTSISPVMVRVGAMYTLPGVDADCRPVVGATVGGWAVPQPNGSTGYGSVEQPYPPGLNVRVIDSQRFTVVPIDPTLRIDYDANVALADTCSATADGGSRLRQVWVPRPDVDTARFATSPPCTPPGHVLVGWNTAGDGRGETHLPGNPLPTGWQSDPASVHHLFAMWVAQP